MCVVQLKMEEKDKKNPFELAIMLMQQQFATDPYSMSKDQLAVLRKNEQILTDLKKSKESGNTSQ